jgi:hypothetical protein
LPRLVERPSLAVASRSTTLVWPRRILAVTDGSPSAEPALVAARLISQGSRSTVNIAVIYAPRIPVPRVSAGLKLHIIAG